MSRLSSIAAALCALLFVCGCSSEFKATSFETGAEFSKTGIITVKPTQYAFHYEKGGSRMKDLCNFIYFEGDTLCFSADFTRDVDGEAQVFFVDPATGKRYPAERIEKLRSRVYGFSLVGSVMEEFLKASLDKEIPAGRTLTLPFVVTVKAVCGGKEASAETKGTLVVRF